MSVSDRESKVRYVVAKAINGVLQLSNTKAYVMLRPGITPKSEIIELDKDKGDWVIYVEHAAWGTIKTPLERDGEFKGLPQYRLASDST